MQYTKKFKSIPYLRKGLTKDSGRNNKGKITTRHHGGGHKQSYRAMDWSRSNPNLTVVGLEYDPMRSASILKLYNDEVATGNYSYIIAPKGTNTFHTLNKFKADSSLQNKLLKPGDAAPLAFFEVGDFIHSIEAFVGQGSIFGRASGSYCQVISVDQSVPTYLKNKGKIDLARVRLPSGNKRLINRNAQATLGIVYQKNETKRNILKAGRIRWLGCRPSVRGVAINPVDHPHGGGQGKTSGGRPSVTFKSWPTKGQPTRSPKRKNNFILKS